jgi:hypothetical protein
MKIRRAAGFGLGLLAFAFPALGAEPSQPVRDTSCYVVMEEGASSEGNSLYLKKMGVDPEVVKTFAPVHFSRAGGAAGGRFSATVQGSFAYQAESPTQVGRSGNLVLYEVPVRLKADPPPKAWKTVSVSIQLSELSGSSGLVQPSILAMDKASASQKMSSGTAWILDMSYSGKGKLKATVGLAK